MAETRCSFLDDDSQVLTPPFFDDRRPASNNHPTASSTPIPTILAGHISSPLGYTDSYDVNMIHLKLFSNLSSKDFLSVEDCPQADIIPAAIYIKHALTMPCLMHQVLAISALHLSTQDNNSQQFYRNYATGLQNSALSLFHKSNPNLEVTQSNCTGMFLFSSSVGVHLLCDTLCHQRNNIEDFTDRFTACLNVHRGVMAVLNQSGNLMRDTELGHHLKSQALPQLIGEPGSECVILQNLIDTVDIRPSTRESYTEAVLRLQQVFDAHRHVPENIIRMPQVIAWLVLVPPEFVDCLRRGRPEALVILAYYAVLLYRGRGIWMLGGGGRFLIESICAGLDPNWQTWLDFPRAALQD